MVYRFICYPEPFLFEYIILVFWLVVAIKLLKAHKFRTDKNQKKRTDKKRRESCLVQINILWFGFFSVRWALLLGAA